MHIQLEVAGVADRSSAVQEAEVAAQQLRDRAENGWHQLRAAVHSAAASTTVSEHGDPNQQQQLSHGSVVRRCLLGALCD